MKYRIGDVERILSIPAETLRFFEKKGIIVPQKNGINNYRYYETFDLNKLVAYKLYRSMEFSMDESIEMLSHLSLDDSIGRIDSQIGVIDQKIKYYKSVLERMKQMKKTYQLAAAMENSFRIEDSPEVIMYHNQVNDAFKTDGMRMETTRIWLKYLPFILMACRMPKETIPSGNIIYWGFSIPTRYEEISAQLDSLLTMKIPSQRSVYTVIKCGEDERLKPRLLRPALDFMIKNGLRLNGDVYGSIVYEENSPTGIVRYFQVWLPAAAK